ncbi:TPA: helix-turn-helix transcriptional regulator [Salmonella enterica]|uniref:Helix-turn-helix transcriptional regulator n=1 Tax=Salmonella enterica TaxID=28901 RepID=A0A750HU75_SALER|nr:helix-turn-helix transcriptional regulator [Salmonella enterica]HAF6262355.1 helix-turn-helix transcriptional regulator [Salmonella enterica]
MDFSERLALAMSEQGVTQGKLAKAVGMAQSSVNKLLNGASGSRRVVEIASVLNVNPEWLSSGIGTMRQSDATVVPVSRNPDLNDPVYRVEVFDIAVSAGPGTFLVSDFAESVRAIEFSDELARSLFGNRPAEIVKMITVDGDSMAPTISAGDQIFVDISVRNFETDGIYTFVFGRTFHVKRLQMQGLNLSVISDNPVYKDWHISESEEDQFFVMGKVLIHQSIKYNRVG